MKKAAQATPNQRLSREREHRGWSQQEVADHIGTTPVNVSRWERGLTSPSPYFRRKLCALFEKSPQQLGLAQEMADEPGEQFLIQAPIEESLVSISSTSPPSLWYVPYRRNLFFTGREDVLKQLYDALFQKNTAALIQPQALSGLGGIGKTQTAIEYAYRYRENYQVVLWVWADTRETLVTDFVAIADLLNLPEKNEQDQGRTLAAVKCWLNEHPDWLLILDNVEDPVMVEEFLPAPGKGHLLLTTRAQTMGAIAQRVELEQMEPEEGALFLLRRAGIIEKEAPLDNILHVHWTKAKEISQGMGGLPLALDQAGAYIEETACGLAGYLYRYQTRQAKLLGLRGEHSSEHPEPVATTWSLCFEKVRRANPAAAELLCLCAFLHPDAIPEEILSGGATDLGPVLQSVAADPLELDAAIRELRKFSLVRRNPDAQTLTIHRLVQAVLKEQLDQDMQRQWAERAVRAINRVFPDPEFATWQRCQRYLPHVQLCATVIEQWGMCYIEAAQLLYQAGNYLRKRGQYREAEPLLIQALDISERNLGSEHPDVASSLNELALLYWDEGKFTQAEPLFLQALEIREKSLGSMHPDLAKSFHDLAYLYWIQGRYTQAEPLFLRALEIREQSLGSMHPDVATNLNNLGDLYIFQGRYAQAELTLQRSLLIRERVLEPDHPEIAESLHDLAFICYCQGQYTRAESLFQRALAIREQALGPEHDSLAYTLDNLAVVCTELGKYAQAESLFQRALTIRERTLGSEHHYVAQTLAHLALLYYTQSKYAQAEPLLSRALAIREQTFGSEHPDVAQSLDILALVYKSQGRYSEAERIAQRSLAIRERSVGLEHPHLASSLNTLAEIYLAQGKYTQAEPLLEQALSIREKALGPEHPRVAEVLENHASLLRKTNKATEATVLEARASAIRSKQAQEALLQ